MEKWGGSSPFRHRFLGKSRAKWRKFSPLWQKFSPSWQKWRENVRNFHHYGENRWQNGENFRHYGKNGEKMFAIIAKIDVKMAKMANINGKNGDFFRHSRHFAMAKIEKKIINGEWQ